jgi:hypothetical protein
MRMEALNGGHNEASEPQPEGEFSRKKGTRQEGGPQADGEAYERELDASLGKSVATRKREETEALWRNQCRAGEVNGAWPTGSETLLAARMSRTPSKGAPWSQGAFMFQKSIS